MEILVIARESWVCSIVLLIEVQHAQLEWMMGPLSNNSLSASFKHSFSTCFSHSLFHSYSQLSLCWLRVNSVAILLGHRSRERIWLLGTSQWQIPSRLLDRASSFSSFSHSLILPKMLFNTLSLPFSCIDCCFDDGSRGISNLHQVAQVPLLENSRRFPSTSHWTLFCAVLSSRQAHVSSASYQIQSIPFKVGDVDAAPLPSIPVLEVRTSAYMINCSAFGFQLCFPACQIVIADFHLSIVW